MKMICYFSVTLPRMDGTDRMDVDLDGKNAAISEQTRGSLKRMLKNLLNVRLTDSDVDRVGDFLLKLTSLLLQDARTSAKNQGRKTVLARDMDEAVEARAWCVKLSELSVNVIKECSIEKKKEMQNRRRQVSRQYADLFSNSSAKQMACNEALPQVLRVKVSKSDCLSIPKKPFQSFVKVCFNNPSVNLGLTVR